MKFVSDYNLPVVFEGIVIGFILLLSCQKNTEKRESEIEREREKKRERAK